MKRKALLILIFLLLTASISSAQVTLVGKSTILPEQPDRFINPYTVQYTQNTRTAETQIVWQEWFSDGVGTTLTGRIINAKGEAVGKAFTIASKPQMPEDSFNCCDSVKITYTYNPISNEIWSPTARVMKIRQDSLLKFLRSGWLPMAGARENRST